MLTHNNKPLGAVFPEDGFTSVKNTEDQFEEWYVQYNKKYKNHNIPEKLTDIKGNTINIKNLCKMCFTTGYSACLTDMTGLLKENKDE